MLHTPALALARRLRFPWPPMRAEELDYDLPQELIASHPPAEREDARLLLVGGQGVPPSHRAIRDLPRLLSPSLFVFNDTKVIPARLLGHKPSGGKFEVLLVEKLAGDAYEQRWLCMARPMKSLAEGMKLSVGPLRLTIGPRAAEAMLEVVVSAPDGVEAAVAAAGQVPLPPYIARSPDSADLDRYQTVFAREPGAVAAPTAGLHFGGPLLDALEAHGHRTAFVTLHVGPGTFAPLGVDDISQHPMHEERYEIPETTLEAIDAARAAGMPVVAVGTTVVRTLEGCFAQHGTLRAGVGRTRLCIYPPYAFRVIDALVTNFHLPRSTLLALVMAFAGVEETRAAYRAAVEARYRFFSYGDAMLVARRGRSSSEADGSRQS